MSSILRQFIVSQDGATSIEYALIAGIVSVSIIAGLMAITSGLSGTFNTVSANLTAASR
jgi:pilus assembly protein Flp/PilA